jgi:hypothetical protein
MFVLLASLGADDPKPAPSPSPSPRPPRTPPDFKLSISLYGIRKDPISRADLVVRGGVAYQFLSDEPDEVIVIEPGRSRVVLLDLERKVQTEITSQKLDASLGQLHRATLAAIERREKTGARADKVAAAISRDLIDPEFKVVTHPDGRRLTLTNKSVEVEAVCEEEPDRERLNMIVNCLAAITKLGALRDPENIPPFTRLATLRTIATSQKLRPVEVSYLYRLAGPPRKLRWTFQVVAELSDRERGALGQLDQIRAKTPFIKFEEYEAAEGE